jgi:hypothetical protein
MGGTGEKYVVRGVLYMRNTRRVGSSVFFGREAHPFTATTQNPVAVQRHSISDMRGPRNWFNLCLLCLTSWVLAAPTDNSTSTQFEKNFQYNGLLQYHQQPLSTSPQYLTFMTIQTYHHYRCTADTSPQIPTLRARLLQT